jgi:hypothetical protein
MLTKVYGNISLSRANIDTGVDGCHMLRGIGAEKIALMLRGGLAILTPLFSCKTRNTLQHPNPSVETQYSCLIQDSISIASSSSAPMSAPSSAFHSMYGLNTRCTTPHICTTGTFWTWCVQTNLYQIRIWPFLLLSWLLFLFTAALWP